MEDVANITTLTNRGNSVAYECTEILEIRQKVKPRDKIYTEYRGLNIKRSHFFGIFRNFVIFLKTFKDRIEYLVPQIDINSDRGVNTQLAEWTL